jgi:hypothetical protein
MLVEWAYLRHAPLSCGSPVEGEAVKGRQFIVAGCATALSFGAFVAVAPVAVAAGPTCSMTDPNARVATGTGVGFGGVATATSVNFFIKNTATGVQSMVGAGGLLFPPSGWVLSFDSTTKADGQYTAMCQATDGSGTGALSTPVPFAIHNGAAPLAAPAASKRGATMGFGQTLPLAQEADAMGTQGTGWVRGGVDWEWLINKGNDVAHGGSVDPAVISTWPWATNTSWGALSYDAQVQHAHALGLKFMAVAVGSPYYANDANDDGLPDPADPGKLVTKYYPNAAHMTDWQRYIRGLIEHGADAIEVWNEPNNAPAFITSPASCRVSGSATCVDPAAQAGLQRNTYDFVKANWPTTVQVITGGATSFTNGLDFCSYSWFDQRSPYGFLAAEYGAPAASYNGGRTFAGAFDAVGNHPYAGSTTTPGSGFGAVAPQPAYCGDGVARVQDLLNVMVAFGDVHPIWLTEYGNRGTGVAPSDIGPFMTGYENGFILLRALGVPIGVTFEFSLHNGSDFATSDDSSYGVYNYDWSEKPSAVVVRNEAAQTADTTVPTVSGVTATATGLTSAAIGWTTTEQATSTVRYGTTVLLGQSASSASGTTHSVVITGLTPGVTYNYVIDSYDGSSNKAAAPNHTFAMPKPYATPIKKAATAKVATTAAFNTAGAAQILVLVQAGGPNSAASQSVAVSSTTPGLSFGSAPVLRSNGQPGDAEVWSATTTGALTGATVTSTEATATAYPQLVTVLVIAKGIGPGGTGSFSATSTTPSAFVGTTQTGSLVFGGGSDFTTAAIPSMAADNTLITSSTVAGSHLGLWSQYLTVPTPSSHPFALIMGTLGQSDQWNFAGVEVKTT